MNTKRDADTILGAWLDDGPLGLPDDTRRAIAVGLRTTPQRRGRFGWLAGPRRGSMFAYPLRLASAIGAVAVIAVVAMTLWQGRLPGLSSGASPSPPASAVPSASASRSPVPSAPASRSPVPMPSPTISAPIATPSPSATSGLEAGPGVQSGGHIFFGLQNPPSPPPDRWPRVYSMAPDGSTVRVHFETDCCLVMSPNGPFVAYAGVWETDESRRMVPAIGTTGDPGFGFGPWPEFAPGINLVPGTWGPDDNLAFAGWADDDQSKTGVYLSRVTGTESVHSDTRLEELRQLTASPGAQDIPIAFSPDGTMLLFMRETREEAGDLYVIGVDGTGLHQLNPAGEVVWVHDSFGPGASWSPDGQRVAFAAFAEGSRSRAYVVAIDGGAATPITDRSSYMTSARWSPNGEWIAYDFDHEPQDGGRDVWLVRPDGSDAHRISGPKSACCAVWSPDSTYLLVAGVDRDGEGLFIASADGSGYSRLLKVDDSDDILWRTWIPAP